MKINTSAGYLKRLQIVPLVCDDIPQFLNELGGRLLYHPILFLFGRHLEILMHPDVDRKLTELSVRAIQAQGIPPAS